MLRAIVCSLIVTTLAVAGCGITPGTYSLQDAREICSQYDPVLLDDDTWTTLVTLLRIARDDGVSASEVVGTVLDSCEGALDERGCISCTTALVDAIW
jgi:hypothetical protein